MEFNNVPVTLFEVSWEVCNKVGGIYSVVSSKALQTRDVFEDNYIVIGPWLQHTSNFEETQESVWDKVRPALTEKLIDARPNAMIPTNCCTNCGKTLVLIPSQAHGTILNL